LNCTFSCFVPCSGRGSVELDSIPPQDLALGDCLSGGNCGLAGDDDVPTEKLLSNVLQQEASKSLNAEEVELLSKLEHDSTMYKLVAGSSDDAEEEFERALKQSHVL